MSAVDPATWDRAVLAHDTATPFHTWSFLDSYAAAAGLAFEPLMVLVGGCVVGGVPQVVRRRGPLRWVGVGAPFSYGGPAVPRGEMAAVLEALARRNRFATVRERYEIRGVTVAELRAPRWKVRRAEAMIVPLEGRTEDELRWAAAKKFRQHLGHAARSGVEIGPADERDVRVLLPQWLDARFADQGLDSPFPSTFVRRVVDDFAGRGAARLHAARVSGETVGVQVSFDHAGRTYPWLIGSAREHDHERLQVPTALSWHLVVEARANGQAEVDLSGAPTLGIRAFKVAMGAVPRSHVVIERGLRS